MSRPVKNLRYFGKEKAKNPDDSVSRKISKLVKKEDKPRDQAVAIALSMKKRGEL